MAKDPNEGAGESAERGDVVSIDTNEVAASSPPYPQMQLSPEVERELQRSGNIAVAEFAGHFVGQVMKIAFPALAWPMRAASTQPQPPSVIEEARAEQMRARAALDLAAAKRMESAEYVEIYESYDVSGKGKAGLEVDGAGATFGVGAEGQRGSERRVVLKGFKDEKPAPKVEGKTPHSPAQPKTKPKAVDQAKPAKRKPGGASSKPPAKKDAPE